jgi:hypothetical protein
MNEQYSEISFFYGEGMAITGRDPLGCIHRYPFRARLGSPPSSPTQKTSGFARGAPLTSSR